MGYEQDAETIADDVIQENQFQMAKYVDKLTSDLGFKDITTEECMRINSDLTRDLEEAAEKILKDSLAEVLGDRPEPYEEEDDG